MKYRLILLAVIVGFTYSCKTDKAAKAGLQPMVEQFADLECRAITLREQRFELANKIRFTQDSLLRPEKTTDTARLRRSVDTFNRDKEMLLKQSLSLADSIKIALNDLMKNKLTSSTDKQDFNQLLNKTLVERGCIKKT